MLKTSVPRPCYTSLCPPHSLLIPRDPTIHSEAGGRRGRGVAATKVSLPPTSFSFPLPPSGGQNGDKSQYKESKMPSIGKAPLLHSSDRRQACPLDSPSRLRPLRSSRPWRPAGQLATAVDTKIGCLLHKQHKLLLK